AAAGLVSAQAAGAIGRGLRTLNQSPRQSRPGSAMAAAGGCWLALSVAGSQLLSARYSRLAARRSREVIDFTRFQLRWCAADRMTMTHNTIQYIVCRVMLDPLEKENGTVRTPFCR